MTVTVKCTKLNNNLLSQLTSRMGTSSYTSMCTGPHDHTIEKYIITVFAKGMIENYGERLIIFTLQ